MSPQDLEEVKGPRKKKTGNMHREGTSNSYVIQKQLGEPQDLGALVERNKGCTANWKTTWASQCLETP